MKIVLVCTSALASITKKENLKVGKPESWIEGHIDLLRKEKSRIIYCFSTVGDKHLSGEDGDIQYYSFDRNAPRNEQISFFQEIYRKEQPDMVHIFGTEYVHSLSAVQAAEGCGLKNRTVVSIQGLASYIGEYHYYAGLPQSVIHAYSFRDFLKKDNIVHQRKKFIQRGKNEEEVLQSVRHVIGRTEWDKACVSWINPKAIYHKCNENLRECFYHNQWKPEGCQRYSVFVSQALYPLKGFHKVLEAASMLKAEYPGLHLYTTGDDPRKKDLLGKIKQTYYQSYLADLIHRFKLDDQVTFLGYLDREAMCGRYLKSHVFVSASSVENSPNSVGEAMMLGVPTVSSDVGGVKSMMSHGIEGFLYPFDETYMLAYYMKTLFDSDEVCIKLSHNARQRAQETHNREKNSQTMMDIYREITEG